MTRARAVLPGKLVHITQRTVAGQYLLLPTKKNVADICRYLFVVACKRYGMQPVGACVMSSHYHALLWDQHGVHPAFTRFLHGNLARALNMVRGRRGNVWENRPPGVVEVPDGDAPEAIRQACYVAMNPVAAGLVRAPEDWPGFWLDPRQFGQKLIARRPQCGLFKDDDKWPEVVEVQVARVPFHDGQDDADVLAALETDIARRQQAAMTTATGKRRTFLGPRRVKRVRWQTLPDTGPFRREIRPCVVASSAEARLAVIARNRAFRTAYAEALKAYLAGQTEVEFPFGTWQMAKRLNVKVATAPS